MDEFKLTVEELIILKDSIIKYWDWQHKYLDEDASNILKELSEKFSEEFVKERRELRFGVTVYLDD